LKLDIVAFANWSKQIESSFCSCSFAWSTK